MSYSMISKVAGTVWVDDVPAWRHNRWPDLRRRLVMACAIAVFSASTAFAQSDPFELKAIWSQQTNFGSIGLSTDQHHGGKTALVLSSRNGGQREIWLTDTFAATKGTWSVWFLDTGAGTQTLYSGLRLANSADSNVYGQVNVADWDATHYVWNGPGIGETSTTVARTNGWHLFKIRVTATEFIASIDGVPVGTVVGDFTFDGVGLFLRGPVWRPNATFYFDDFKTIKLQ